MSRKPSPDEASTERVAVSPDLFLPTREFQAIQPPTSPVRPDRLHQLEGPGAPRELSLGRLPQCIGRDPRAEISVASSHVSRHHLQISREGDETVVTDLGSHNGAWLNHIRIHEASLRDGDILQVGDAVFVYYRGS